MGEIKSKQTFIEWNCHATSEEKQKMLKTALFYNERYNKDEDIRDYDIQDRMIIIKRDLDEKHLLEIYPDIRKLSSYIGGDYWTSYWDEKRMCDYFRKNFYIKDLYDYHIFLSIMVMPGIASWRGIRPTTESIKTKIHDWDSAYNDDTITAEEYKKGLDKLLNDYFNSLTKDADAQLRAMKEYEAEIELAHQQQRMSDKVYKLHKLIMWSVKHSLEDFCNTVYFD